MEKRIYDKKTGIHYELQGDYYLPYLELSEQSSPEAIKAGRITTVSII